MRSSIDMKTKLVRVYTFLTTTMKIERPSDYLSDPKWHDTKWHALSILDHSLMFGDLLKKEKDIDHDFLLAGYLHDIGKFISPWSEEKKEFRHPGHEKLGEELIKKYKYQFSRMFPEGKNWRRIAELVGLHYELAKIRKAAKLNPLGYTLEWVHSKECRDECRKVKEEFPKYEREIGLMFKMDNLSKVVDGKPLPAAEQLPVNMGIYEVYINM